LTSYLPENIELFWTRGKPQTYILLSAVTRATLSGRKRCAPNRPQDPMLSPGFAVAVRRVPAFA